ncbi:trypsin-like peptidase domain-containing protein [Streptomyces sp. NPDC088350]|uniref:S1C family serine protease n=1 Tax=Streptomyces sp. NPDC088350 TaxID=3365854 RepID=UPI003817D1B7
MNDGTPNPRPTKSTWWGRGRAADSRAATPGADVVDVDADTGGDFTLWPPDAVRDGASRATGDDGFESRAVGEGLSGEAASGEGDFELARPVPEASSAGVVADADGGPESGRPGSEFLAGGAGAGAVAGTGGDSAPVRPAAGSPTGGVAADVDGGDVDVEPTSPAPAPAHRPKPLHDPDPYGTPPYGQPGPWAPAPPVQHPVVTAGHDTAPQMPTAAPGAPGAPTPPSPAPSDSSSPSPSVPRPASTDPHPASAAPVAASEPPGTSDQPFPEPEPDPGLPATDPWHRYDPWASPAPLQQTGAPAPAHQQHHNRARKRLAASALGIALLSGGVGGVVGAYVERDGLGGDIVLTQAGGEDTGRAPGSVAGIAARALPSVVTLHVTGDEESGTGTGVVLDTRGHILTNNHVVQPAGSDGEISVRFSGGQTVKAKVVGHDAGYDLAVVQVSGVRGLRPMPLGNSDNVRVGDPVVAIGAPFDLDNTVTSGIISAKDRPITAGGDAADGSDVSYVDALQTDAPINPGNSGGPLLDSRARLVGINSAIRSADNGLDTGDGQAGSIGLGFAIPVNQAKRVAEELINTGKATHPVIGVTLDMNYTGDGARVAAKGSGDGPAVSAGGPGAKAGLQAGDVITEVDGERVHSGDELIVRTRAHRPGDQLRLTLRRDGKDMTVSLVLGSSTGG